MNEFKPLEIKDFTDNPFEIIGKQWMLITAKKDDQVNTMTASWGGMGVLWGHNVVYIFVRKSRYTKEFIDEAKNFSLTFFAPEYKKALSYFGKVSGRDEDKIKQQNFTVLEDDDTPYFAEANTVILCEKLSKHLIAPEGIIDESILPKCYSDEDYHYMYVGRIKQILKK